MPKNIVICSDGTGNSLSKIHGTNVWRIFNAVHRHDPALKQITYYDDGVGTDSIKLLRLLGGAFGWGLKRNILQAYAFLAMNYNEGDKVFLFGFSRGAFTVRSLAGLIGRCGLICRDKFLRADSHKTRKAMLRQVMKAYRSTKKFYNKSGENHQKKACRIRKELGLCNLKPHSIPIHFIGVWDTVDAVGLPFDKLKRKIGCIWANISNRRLWHFNNNVPHHCIYNAYQALALDDERKTFHPLLWKSESQPSNSTNTHICQVWFAGAHANVGGGYPKDSLSLVPLLWMMDRANSRGLRFLASKWREYREAADPHGRMYDSRTGMGMIYRYAPRNIYEHEGDPAIHASVFDRIARRTDYYAPKVIRNGQFTKVLL